MEIGSRDGRHIRFAPSPAGRGVGVRGSGLSVVPNPLTPALSPLGERELTELVARAVSQNGPAQAMPGHRGDHPFAPYFAFPGSDLIALLARSVATWSTLRSHLVGAGSSALRMTSRVTGSSLAVIGVVLTKHRGWAKIGRPYPTRPAMGGERGNPAPSLSSRRSHRDHQLARGRDGAGVLLEQNRRGAVFLDERGSGDLAPGAERLALID